MSTTATGIRAASVRMPAGNLRERRTAGRIRVEIQYSEKESIEDIALRHTGRGMNSLRPYLPRDFYRRTAARLLNVPGRTVLLATGFCVAGVCETDGPPGTYCAVKVLQSLGFRPVIVTDPLCQGLFTKLDVPVIYADFDEKESFFRDVLDTWKPAALISIERCGRNAEGDYANMRGLSIAKATAPIDRMFDMAAERGIFTVGIGDGGNEIGMGNLAEEVRRYTPLNPCTVTVDDLLIAAVSNWGAYALSVALILEAGKGSMPSYPEIASYIRFLADRGCVDGVTHEPNGCVDGFSPEIEKEIYTDLTALLMHV